MGKRRGTTQLDRALDELARAQARTQENLDRISAEEAVLRAESRKQWGDLANKLGTIVEDIIAPNLRGVARDYFGVEELDTFAPNMRRRRSGQPGTQREFDVIAYSEQLFFVVEAKSTPKSDDARAFVAFLPEIPTYFPEAVGKKLIPVFSSLQVPDDIVTYLSRHGVYCMVMGEDNMVLANFDEASAATE